MNCAKKRVLLLDGYARQTLPMVRGFKKIGCDITVVCYSKLDIGYTSNVPDHRILLKCRKDDFDKQYIEIKSIIESGIYDIVVPMNDYGALFLSKNKEYFSNFSYIAVNDFEVFSKAIDKFKTMEVCERYGIPCPKTYFFNNEKELLNKNDLAYPIVIKPKTACGSIGFNIAENREHLKRILSSKMENGEIFAQEYIPQAGSQYGVETFRNKNGVYNFLVVDEKPRWFPLDGGSPTINISVHHNEIKEMAIKLLDSIDWVGYANIDILIDKRDNRPKIIEINGRISAAVALDEFLGINVAELIYCDYMGEEGHIYNDYKDGKKVSCFMTELLWFIKSKNRFKSKPSMFNRKNTRDVIFKFGDIKPSFSFFLQSIKNYKTSMRMRKRKK